MEGACVFCERKNLEERLIAETATLYFVATLGQITDGGYTLIIPKRHVPCVGAMEKQEVAEIERAVRIASAAIGMEYGVRPTVFEHGIVGQTVLHAHLHLLPARIWMSSKIRSDFLDAKFASFVSLEGLRRHYAERPAKYLLWSVPPDWALWTVWDPQAPPQYLRIAAAELMGRPERANWRNMDPELDKKLWSETVTRLAPYLR